MKQYTFILSFGCLTSDDKLSRFKFFLECELIKFRLHVTDEMNQFVFNNISQEDYANIKQYYYTNFYTQEVLYDINDLMFKSYNNYEEDEQYDEI